MTPAVLERAWIAGPAPLLLPTRYAFAPVVSFSAPVAAPVEVLTDWRGLRDEFEAESESEA